MDLGNTQLSRGTLSFYLLMQKVIGKKNVEGCEISTSRNSLILSQL